VIDMRVRRLITGLAAIGVVTALAAACSTSAGSGGQLDGKTWALTSYASGGAMQQVPAEVLADATFVADESNVSGSAGCNRFTGGYRADGASLTFGALATTQMACVGPANDVEAAYLANLAATRTYTATGDALTMFGANGDRILVFAVAQPGDLSGVEWHATGINNGRGAVESVVAGTDPTATYDATAGTVRGNAGCNQYNGPVVVEGDSITIGPLASTKMACADQAAADQEAAYLAALEAATTFEVRNQTLELRDDDGALQVSFETR
jgi:heat shock protein HslJ